MQDAGGGGAKRNGFTVAVDRAKKFYDKALVGMKKQIPLPPEHEDAIRGITRDYVAGAIAGDPFSKRTEAHEAQQNAVNEADMRARVGASAPFAKAASKARTRIPK